MRRVVITGVGMVTPLGANVETVWANILASKSGAGLITRFDATDYACKIAMEVKHGDGTGDTFDQTRRIDHKVLRQVDPFIIFGIDAAGQALEDAGLTDMTEEERYRAGCMIGSGIGGLPGIEKESIVLHEKGPRRVSPHFVHGRLINLISGQVSIKYGLMGPNHAVVTACSTGAHAIGDAARLIALDDADVMLAGGSEGAICPLGIAGFSQAKALATSFNDEPTRASRPYDRDRDGFVMGEGAGIVCLEEYERAKARGATIYAEVIGYGLTGDAYHVTAPQPEGSGRSARCRWRCAGPGSTRRTSTISTPTAPRRWPTRSSSARSGACSAVRSRRSVFRRPSRRSAICSAGPGRSKASSARWRCATRSRRRRSISTIRRRAARGSISSPTSPSRAAFVRC
jgi:3-oxoacyl-[acyl-carrier-protein] synthase II